ncbi:MAG: replicative DNA helicase [Calditerrivibrio sp.]|nr:replicative DNA helicase [Calditerrivibrio sp.]
MYIYNLEAEQKVLDAIITYGKNVLTDIIGTLKPIHFYDAKNAVIYEQMIEMYNDEQDIDMVLLIDNLKKTKRIHQAGGEYYIASLVSSSISAVPSLVNTYAAVIVEKYIHRELLKSFQTIIEQNLTDVGDIIDNIETKVIPLIESIKLGGYEISDAATAIKDLFHTITADSEDDKKIRSYLKALDNIIIRFRPQNYIIIAARPSVGKTALALSIMYNIAKHTNDKMLFFSFEMSKNEIIARLLSMITGIQVTNIIDNKLTIDDWKKINEATALIEKMNLFIIDDASLTVDDIYAIVGNLNKNKDLKLVVIDYIQLIPHKEIKKNREEKISEISRQLKRIAKKENIPIIALAQLNRDIEKRKDKRPMLSDLRESGSLEQDADIVMMMYKPDTIDEFDSDMPVVDGITQIIVAKNRNGSIGEANILFKKDNVLFTDYEPTNKFVVSHSYYERDDDDDVF